MQKRLVSVLMFVGVLFAGVFPVIGIVAMLVKASHIWAGYALVGCFVISCVSLFGLVVMSDLFDIEL